MPKDLPVIRKESLLNLTYVHPPHVYYLTDKNQYSYFLLLPGHIPVM